jgi:YbgC/YbaW family acyl-CoA thioester hydrolase
VGEAFFHELRVRYGECDPQGIVFNANYLLYADVGFTELWREAVGPWQEMVAEGVDAVVAHADIDFRAPARFDDELRLGARVLRLGRTDSDHDGDRRAPRRGAAGGDQAAPCLRLDRDVAQDRSAGADQGRAGTFRRAD